ncbi:hypothetical protein Barb7_03226 [Bacteroidales bacterium Barb7]|nr:hypothetical protein Barb7_03226 [Bacteroidales bacterium Barb7]
MKKINITTGALLLYLIVMSVIGYPGGEGHPEKDFTTYFCMIGATLAAVFLLRFLQIKRLRMREKQRNDKN